VDVLSGAPRHAAVSSSAAASIGAAKGNGMRCVGEVLMCARLERLAGTSI
jgi:hypothetical protein